MPRSSTPWVARPPPTHSRLPADWLSRLVGGASSSAFYWSINTPFPKGQTIRRALEAPLIFPASSWRGPVLLIRGCQGAGPTPEVIGAGAYVLRWSRF